MDNRESMIKVATNEAGKPVLLAANLIQSVNSQRLISLLAGFMLLSAFITALLGTRLYFSTRARTRLQAQANSIQQQRAMVQNLARDSVAYGQSNPKIYPILEQFDIIKRSTNAPSLQNPRQ